MIRHHRRTTTPSNYPISITDLMAHLRLTAPGSEAELEKYLKIAIPIIEDRTGRILIATNIEVIIDGYPDAELQLPYRPIVSVITFSSYALDGTESSVDSDIYFIDAPRGRLILNYGRNWPTDIREKKSFRIEYQAGYGDIETAVPQIYKHLLRGLVAHMYTFRVPDREQSELVLSDPILSQLRHAEP